MNWFSNALRLGRADEDALGKIEPPCRSSKAPWWSQSSPVECPHREPQGLGEIVWLPSINSDHVSRLGLTPSNQSGSAYFV